MSINVTTSANGTALNELLTPMVLGARTLEKGLMRMVLSQQDKVALSRFTTALNKLEAPVDTPLVANDSMTKDEVTITLGDQMWYDTWNPIRDFEEDWSYFYSTGQLTEAQVAPQIRTAIQQTVVESVTNNLENLIWNGDTASGDVWLQRMDGLVKIIAANADVIDVTNIGVVTKANIIEILDAIILATPDAVIESANPKLIMSYKDKQIYDSVLRDAGISKGVNIQDSPVSYYGGFEIVSCGIPKDNILFTVASTGKDSNLVGATWMDADFRGVKIAKLQENSELWFAKVLFKFGVNIVFGGECVSYVGVVIP